LAAALAVLDKALVCSRVATHNAFVFLPATWIFSDAINVFAFAGSEAFAILQSRVHEIWARFFSSSMKDDLRYSPTDCFETFPLPANWQSNQMLQLIGEEYYSYRANLMIRTGKGLTETYNRFHSQTETDTEIVKLRELHAKMDRAVLDAYGWTDLQPRLDFILDYEDKEDDEIPSSDRKKPWRYRWVDEDRDEVLARLLELNRIRAEEEAQSAAAAPAARTASKRSRKPTEIAPVANHSLFDA